ncbi:MAG TPA: hypothetical protein ENF73_02990, partial [Proteobacteria bacterium]|nr:hypothetical protein [Pseudomonadota bacterium]
MGGCGCDIPPDGQARKRRRIVERCDARAQGKGVMKCEMTVFHGPPKISYPSRSRKVEREVRRIIGAVRERGDEAVREFALRFDGLKRRKFEVSLERVDALAARVQRRLAGAMRSAHRAIVAFARDQKKVLGTIRREFDGHTATLEFVPVERVLCYIPGGRAPLPSTALMTIAPAKVAGVREIIATTPKLTPEIAFATRLAGA